MSEHQPLTIIGAGLTGSLLAIFLARRGYHVNVYERSMDMRLQEVDAGRSINLALAHRGIRALKKAGVFDKIKPMLVPMAGRQLHAADGTQQFQAYGSKRHEVNYSLSRAGLNKALMTEAEETGQVTFHFRHACLGVNLEALCINIRDQANQEVIDIPAEHVFACDGAGSRIRRDLVAANILSNRDELLDHAYKELTIPAGVNGEYQIIREALHIWPRGQYMLIALPNDDGSFTLTLFMPKHGENSFSELRDDDSILKFFRQQFPDTLDLIPDLLKDFKNNPQGVLGTVYCNPLH
ncbi:MAG: FAD-dependent monooxygenase, partial [Gammaproteobacteria bacterium]|nr:FAD-dependent monooxygenase [Gammaproteobacteria bacterium]